MQDVSFIDNGFNKKKAHLYCLSIQISLDGFSFSVLDIREKKYLVLKDFSCTSRHLGPIKNFVSSVVTSEDILSLRFRSVRVLYASRKFTLVPKAYYSPGTINNFFNFAHTRDEGTVIGSTFLNKSNAWCIYDIPVNLAKFLKVKFPKTALFHHSYSLIEKSTRHNGSLEGKQRVHLNFFKSHFDLIALSGQDLLFYNSFYYNSEQDILYFVMLIFNQLKLPTDKTEVFLHGKILQTSPHFQLLRRYISKVSFATARKTYRYSNKFSQVPEHYYTSLLDL